MQHYFKSLHCLPLQDIVLTLIFIQRSSLACMQSVARGTLPFPLYMDRLLPVLFSYFGGSCREAVTREQLTCQKYTVVIFLYPSLKQAIKKRTGCDCTSKEVGL